MKVMQELHELMDDFVHEACAVGLKAYDGVDDESAMKAALNHIMGRVNELTVEKVAVGTDRMATIMKGLILLAADENGECNDVAFSSYSDLMAFTTHWRTMKEMERLLRLKRGILESIANVMPPNGTVH